MDALAIRVVVVEDHDGFRRTLRRLLEAAGVQVVGEAGDGSAGVVASQYWAPDVVVTDYQMPIMDGLGMARLIKAAPHPPAIVMLTGSGMLLDRVTLRTAGVDRVLEKGCATEVIVAALEGLVRPRRGAIAQIA